MCYNLPQMMAPANIQKLLHDDQLEHQKFVTAFNLAAENWSKATENKKNAKRRLEEAFEKLLKGCASARKARPDLAKYQTVGQLISIEKKGEVHDLWGQFTSRLDSYVRSKLTRWNQARDTLQCLEKWDKFVKKVTKDASGHGLFGTGWASLKKQCDLTAKIHEDFFAAVLKSAKSNKPSHELLEKKYREVKLAGTYLHNIETEDV